MLDEAADKVHKLVLLVLVLASFEAFPLLAFALSEPQKPQDPPAVWPFDPPPASALVAFGDAEIGEEAAAFVVLASAATSTTTASEAIETSGEAAATASNAAKVANKRHV